MSTSKADRETAVYNARKRVRDAMGPGGLAVFTPYGSEGRDARDELEDAARAAGRGEAEGALRKLMTGSCSRCGWDFTGLEPAELDLWKEYNEGCICAEARALLSEPAPPPEATS